MKVYIVILFQIFCFYHLDAQTIDWDAIDFKNTQSVTGVINGLNMGGYAYGRINNQSNNITVPSECNECGTALPLISGASYSSMETKANVVTETARLKPGLLRFPGGTHSGWYHLYEYNNQGLYDAAAPQIDKGYGMTAIEAGHLNNPLSYCRQDSRLTVNQNYIDGFINYVKNIQEAIDDKVEVTYVANLLTHYRFLANQTIFSNCGRERAITPMDNYDCTNSLSFSYEGNESLFNNDPAIYRFELYYKETQDAIDILVNNLALTPNDILYVEMGNEYYSTSGYPFSKYEMDIGSYASLVEIYAERLNCYFNNRVDLRIGAVTKPNTEWQTNFVNHLADDVNASGGTLNDAVDAVIYHNYYTSSNCLDETDIQARFNCAKETFRNHIEVSLPNDLDILQNDFPDQEIWITEWNMVGGDNSKNNDYINTILHASFVQEYALSILEYNASHNNAVSMLAHHRIGDHNAWSVIQTQDGSNTVANYRSGAYAMEYMSKLYDYGNMSFVGNILSAGSELFDSKDAKVSALVQYNEGVDKPDKLLLYFSNKTNNDIPFIIPPIIDEVAVEDAKISSLNGAHLFTYGPRNVTAGRNRFTSSGSNTINNEDLNNLGYGLIDDQFESTSEQELSIDVQNTLPKNSIGIIEIILNNICVNLSSVEENDFEIQISPNPASESFTVSIDSKIHGDFQLQLFSNLGNKILGVPVRLHLGKNLLPVDSNNLTDGIYLLILKNANNSVTRRLVIKR